MACGEGRVAAQVHFDVGGEPAQLVLAPRFDRISGLRNAVVCGNAQQFFVVQPRQGMTQATLPKKPFATGSARKTGMWVWISSQHFIRRFTSMPANITAPAITINRRV